jgi:cell division inhibitor SepF
MAGAFRRVMVYLGLVDDDYEEYEPYEDPQPVAPVRQVRTSYAPEPMEGMTAGVRTIAPREPDPTSGVSIQTRPAVVRPVQPTQAAKVHVVAPSSFNDAKEIGDRLKENQPVILNLQNVDPDLRRRMMDFTSGAAYVLGAHLEKVGDRVLLVTPTNVEVSADEKRRLQERGLYRQ